MDSQVNLSNPGIWPLLFPQLSVQEQIRANIVYSFFISFPAPPLSAVLQNNLTAESSEYDYCLVTPNTSDRDKVSHYLPKHMIK